MEANKRTSTAHLSLVTLTRAPLLPKEAVIVSSNWASKDDM